MPQAHWVHSSRAKHGLHVDGLQMVFGTCVRGGEHLVWRGREGGGEVDICLFLDDGWCWRVGEFVFFCLLCLFRGSLE